MWGGETNMTEQWTLFYKAFRHVETFFNQGKVFIRPGPLLVGGIAPTNSGPGRK